MSDNVLITPASRKIEFFDSAANVDAKIETDSSGNLLITNTGGDISIGDTSSDIFVGDGTNSVDIVFEQNGEIRGVTGVTLTLGQSDSNVQMATDLNLNTNDIINVNNLTVGGYLAGPSTFTIDPAGVGDNTGTVVIAGNLQVDGTTTTINSTTVTVDDLNLTLASGAANAAAANGAGLTVDGANATITYDSSNDEWDFNKNINITGNLILSGTVDGRDVAADGSKLDGIESGATADQSASEILTAIKTVDGSGSGLDADLLDGISSASFLRSDTSDTFTSGTLSFSSGANLAGGLQSKFGGFYAPQNPEGTHFKGHTFFNDIAYARLRGSTISVDVDGTAMTSTTNIDNMLSPNSNFWNMSTSGVTTVTITITSIPSPIQFGSYMGVNFIGKNWRAKDITLEYSQDNGSSWSTAGTFTDQGEEFVVSSFNSGNINTNALRWTLEDFNAPQMRINGLFAYNYNSPGMSGLYLPLGGGTVYGNIGVSGTVDGRDVSADGTKLDGIESGATADQTASEILTAIKTVDGSGSGLDADLLDGQHGSYYLNYQNLTNTPGASARIEEFPTVTNGSASVTMANSYTLNRLDVYLNGARMKSGTDYSVSGTTLTFTENLQTGDIVAIYAYDLDVNNLITGNWNDLNDVSVTGASANDIIRYDGGSWVVAPASIDSSGNLTTNGDLTVSGGQVGVSTASTRHKYSVYGSSSQYAIGMQSGITFGGLADWGMTFQFNNEADRGFWWGDEAHTTAKGAMALTTNGKLTVAHSARIGYGETDTTIPGATHKVDVNGSVNATTYHGDGSNLTGISAGATGGSTDQVFYENDQTITTNYTITTNKNAMTAGPITINSGVTVTIPTGSEWSIV